MPKVHSIPKLYQTPPCCEELQHFLAVNNLGKCAIHMLITFSVKVFVEDHQNCKTNEKLMQQIETRDPRNKRLVETLTKTFFR